MKNGASQEKLCDLASPSMGKNSIDKYLTSTSISRNVNHCSLAVTLLKFSFESFLSAEGIC